ncbi:hypothetical protein NCS56_00869300 [Fusarium sp. Ph1]|nr:hypothetical protein NCS56_00869300 [Fusarium sp. Ph1]
MAHAGQGEGYNSDAGDGGEARDSWNIEDMNQARVSEDDGSSAEREPVKGDAGADTSSSSPNNEDKAPPEDESQGKGSSSDEEHGHEPSNTEDQGQESSNEQNMDAEQGSLPVNNMTRGVPTTEEIQSIQEIQPMQEIQPVQEIHAISTVDQPEGALANDETPAVEGSFSWKLWRCWEGTLDCCGTCLVDPECVRDVFNVETPELLCVSRLLDRIYQ